MKLIIVFMFLGMLSCSTSKTEDLQKVSDSMESVFFQRWTAGVRGGGSGINFQVNLKAPLSKEETLEKVQFESYEATFEKKSETTYVAFIKTPANQNDLILDENPEKEYGNKAPTVNLKPKEANLFFKINGKEVIKNLQNVKEKEMLAYPSMERPKN